VARWQVVLCVKLVCAVFCSQVATLVWCVQLLHAHKMCQLQAVYQCRDLISCTRWKLHVLFCLLNLLLLLLPLLLLLLLLLLLPLLLLPSHAGTRINNGVMLGSSVGGGITYIEPAQVRHVGDNRQR
jgi:hypothetical protein